MCALKTVFHPMRYIGERIGHVVILAIEDIDSYGNYVFLCRCDCGNKCIRTSHELNHPQKDNSCKQPDCWDGVIVHEVNYDENASN